MSRWIAALLHAAAAPRCPGQHGHLPPAVVRDTLQPQSVASHMIPWQLRRPRTDAPFRVDGYGLGWFTGHYRGKCVLLKATDSERKCADTIGTVLVPWAGHF